LSLPRVDEEAAAVFEDFEMLWNRTSEHLDALREALDAAGDAAALEEDSQGTDEFHQGSYDEVEILLHSGTPGLQHQVIAIAVHHESWQSVPLAVDQPVVGPAEQGHAQSQGIAQTAKVEVDIDLGVGVAGQDAGAEEGVGIDVGKPKGLAPVILDATDTARCDGDERSAADVHLIAIDPWVPDA